MIKQIFLALLLFSLVAVAFIAYQFVRSYRTGLRAQQVRIGEAVFNVEIANTIPSRISGLSNRESLAEDAGMLFVFPVAMPQGFWMKDMKFPIDIIWIKENRVVGLVIGAEPETGPDYTIYRSPEPVDKVLEINAGLSIKRGIKVGDDVRMVE